MSIDYLKARHQPERYIDSLLEAMFDGTVNGKRIKAPQAKFDEKAQLDPIDWLHVVPFRHQENWFFDYKGENGSGYWPFFLAFTFPWKVKKWMKNELGATNVKNEYMFRGKNTWNKLINLGRELNEEESGKLVVLLVEAQYLLDKTAARRKYSKPNHFVVLTAVEEVEEDEEEMLKLTVYSWGDLRTVTLNRADIKKCIWGFTHGNLPEADDG